MPEEVKQNSQWGTALKWVSEANTLEPLKSWTKNNIYGFFGSWWRHVSCTTKKAEQERGDRFSNPFLPFCCKDNTPASMEERTTIILSSHNPVETISKRCWMAEKDHPPVRVLLLGKREAVNRPSVTACWSIKGAANPMSSEFLPPRVTAAWLDRFAPTLDDIPPKSIALIDEAYLPYHARQHGRCKPECPRLLTSPDSENKPWFSLARRPGRSIKHREFRQRQLSSKTSAFSSLNSTGEMNRLATQEEKRLPR